MTRQVRIDTDCRLAMDVYDVRKLPKGGETLNEALEPEWLEAQLNEATDNPDLRLVAPTAGSAKLTLRPVDPERRGLGAVRITGRVEADLVTACVRCLSEITLHLENPIEAALFPAPAAEDKKEEATPKRKAERVELETEQLDESTYEGHTIDLGALVREALLLAMDMNPACADEKACEARTDTLLGSAQKVPQKDEIDPRWAALKNFRLKSS